MNTKQVFNFIEQQTQGEDVIIFSPLFDHCAFFINVVEQILKAHPGIEPAFYEICTRFFPGVKIESLVMTSKQTIFCNYFVAKPAFWRA